MPLVSFDTKVSKEPVAWHGLNNAFLNPIKPAINKSVTNLGQYFESTGIIIIITPTNIYLFKLNNRNTRKRCEICSKLTIKTTANVSWGVYFNIFTKEYILIYQSSNKIFNRMMTLPQLFYRPAVLKNFGNFMHLQHYFKKKFFYIKS